MALANKMVKNGNLFQTALTLLTVFCLLVTTIYVINATYFQWLYGEKWGGDSPHGSTYFFSIITLFAIIPTLCLVCLSWFYKKSKEPASQRNAPAQFLALIVCVFLSFVPHTQYAAMAVYLLGPGLHSKYLQYQAARWDSSLLLNSLVSQNVTIAPDMLVYAVTNGSQSVLRQLIAMGVPVNGQFLAESVSPLHIAVREQMYAIAEVLLEAGARVDVPDAQGRTPIDIAKQMNDSSMIEILARTKGTAH